MENRIYIKGRKGNRARARRNQKEKEKSGKREKWKVERNCSFACRFTRGCVDWMMHPADWRNVFLFFFKVLRSEWQSGKEDLSSCPGALYSLGFFLFFLLQFCSRLLLQCEVLLAFIHITWPATMSGPSLLVHCHASCIMLNCTQWQ